METTQLETGRQNINEMCFEELQTSSKRKQIANDFEHLRDILDQNLNLKEQICQELRPKETKKVPVAKIKLNAKQSEANDLKNLMAFSPPSKFPFDRLLSKESEKKTEMSDQYSGFSPSYLHRDRSLKSLIEELKVNGHVSNKFASYEPEAQF